MAYIKPKNPLKDNKTDNYFYPITTIDQIIIDDATRLSDYTVVANNVYYPVLSSSAWINKNNQYIQKIIIDTLSESYNVDVYVAYTGILDTDLLIKNSAKCVKYAIQNNNIITFYCLENKPESDIPIGIEVSV